MGSISSSKRPHDKDDATLATHAERDEPLLAAEHAKGFRAGGAESGEWSVYMRRGKSVCACPWASTCTSTHGSTSRIRSCWRPTP